ncbi:hypothetical protein [Maribellus mangrovi]|uniref:hypothetical protein n=1 Tax=Maribellus mangrovi TaxID=3133146 RepID=UPI0030EBD3EA
MKTLTVLFLGVILILAGCSKTDDFPEGNMSDIQLKSADSRTINFELTDFLPVPYYTEVYCDGEVVDILEEYDPGSEITVHVTAHIIDGIFVWAVMHAEGTLTSKVTGEIFKVNDNTRITFDENGEVTSNIYHVHAKGDQGTHIMNFFELDFEAQTYVLTKSVCPGDDE